MKKELILKILGQLDKSNKILSQKELQIDNEQYGQIFDIMVDSHLISETDSTITLKGIEYLEQSKDNYNRLIGAMNNFPREICTSKYKLNINQTY